MQNSDDEIYISQDFINKLLIDLNNNYITRQDVINEIAVTIVHEIIHRNRTIILDNSLKIDDMYLYDKYNKIFDKDEIEDYKRLLDESISSGFYYFFDRYVPFKLTFKNNNLLDVVAYDKSNNTFCIYNNQFFGNDKENNIDLFLVGLELNSENINHKKDNIIPYKNGNYEEDYFFGSVFYYHQQYLNESSKDRNYRLNNIEYLEENLVEVIAKLIIFCRKDKKINLDKFLKFLNKNVNSEKITAKMISMMGIPMIRWFILSSYEDEYDDKLYKAFNNKYNLLLKYFKKLSENEHDEKTLNRIDKILEGKLRK